jgi:sporulation protein YlmC with PRC-barrel domain
MQAAATTKTVEPTYWKAEKAKEVYTEDGKLLGTLNGIMVDPMTWTVSHFVIDVHKDMAEEMNIKKPMFGAAMANIPASLMKDDSDVMQLNSNLASVKSAITVHNPKES